MERQSTCVTIDPEFDVVYASFYLYGLEQVFGKESIRFGRLFDKPQGMDALNFMVRKGNKETRVTIALADDFRMISEELYDWCDVYGSVNANFAKIPERFRGKLVALCPSFGIRCWSFPRALHKAVALSGAARIPLKKHYGKYYRMLKRPRYEDYAVPSRQHEPDARYVFSVSTLWYDDEWNGNDVGVNARRANFIRACRELNEVRFEGGLVSQGPGRSSDELFSDCLCGGVAMGEWMNKTKRSALVFNTPSFWGCHGWKLGEYLAMGKCIISTPLTNDLPEPLEHGVNIHFVDNSIEAMKDAVGFILNHPEYAKQLACGAKDYWNGFGSPTATMERLGLYGSNTEVS